jgi:hypothetical protein
LAENLIARVASELRDYAEGLFPDSLENYLSIHASESLLMALRDVTVSCYARLRAMKQGRNESWTSADFSRVSRMPAHSPGDSSAGYDCGLATNIPYPLGLLVQIRSRSLRIAARASGRASGGDKSGDSGNEAPHAGGRVPGELVAGQLPTCTVSAVLRCQCEQNPRLHLRALEQRLVKN